MTPTPTIVFTSIVGSLLYFGLAILGAGGFAAFFSHRPLIAITVIGLILAGVALFSGGNLSPGEREDRANRWVLVVFGIIGILSAWLPAYKDRIDFWTIDGEAIRWLGVVLFAGWRAAALAGLRARPPFQRSGRHPAGAYACDKRRVWGHSKPKLSGSADQFAGMGARFSLGCRRAACATLGPAAHRTNKL